MNTLKEIEKLLKDNVHRAHGQYVDGVQILAYMEFYPDKHPDTKNYYWILGAQCVNELSKEGMLKTKLDQYYLYGIPVFIDFTENDRIDILKLTDGKWENISDKVPFVNPYKLIDYKPVFD